MTAAAVPPLYWFVALLFSALSVGLVWLTGRFRGEARKFIDACAGYNGDGQDARLPLFRAQPLFIMGCIAAADLVVVGIALYVKAMGIMTIDGVLVIADTDGTWTSIDWNVMWGFFLGTYLVGWEWRPLLARGGGFAIVAFGWSLFDCGVVTTAYIFMWINEAWVGAGVYSLYVAWKVYVSVGIAWLLFCNSNLKFTRFSKSGDATEVTEA